MKLPLDAEVNYFSDFMSPAESAELFGAVSASCDLSDTTVVAAGRKHRLTTGKCMFVDAALMDFDLLPEAFGNRQPWPEEVRHFKERIESISGKKYNVCVGLYYGNGESGMDFHSDLPAFGDTSSIASVSLGQEREFAFRRIDNPVDTYSLRLKNGSLLIMGEHCQDRYQHALPVDPSCTCPRLNLTFRAFGFNLR